MKIIIFYRNLYSLNPVRKQSKLYKQFQFTTIIIKIYL